MVELDDEKDDMFVVALIRDLALSRSDCVSEQKRNDLMRLVENFLSEKPGSRKALAEASEIRCTSKGAYKRTARIYCVSIRHEIQDTETRKKLCLGLSSILKKSKDGNLVNDCKQSLGIGGKKKRDDSEKIQQIFKQIASDNQSTLGIPAVALLETTNWELFVKLSLNSDTIATVGDIELCRCILKSMDKDIWEKTVGPAAILKLKAKPESVLGLMEGMTRVMDAKVLATSKIIADEYLPLLNKNLKSPRDSVRELSSLILQNIAKAAIRTSFAAEGESAVSKGCLVKLLDGVADTKSLTQPHQRLIVYNTFFEIGRHMMGTASNFTVSRSKSTGSQYDIREVYFPIEAKSVSTVLTGLCAAVNKEAKSATENRDIGIKALLAWTVIAKRNANGGGSGYEEALSFIRKPVIAKNGSEALAVVGAMVRQVHHDTVEKLLLDLWKDESFSKGLDAFVEDGNKKQTTLSSIPPVDGLLAVYLNLLYSSVSSTKLSALVEQALSAGSFPVDKTSFVFGKAITSAVPCNPLVGQMLPHTIALYSKCFSTGKATPTKLKHSSSKVRALACCITHPASIGMQTPAEAVETIVRTIIDCEQIAEPLVMSLWDRINDLSLEYQMLQDSLNENRLSREDTKIVALKGSGNPSGSHSGACVGSVRRVARFLSTCTLSASALVQALTLMHSGTSTRANGQQRATLVKNTSQGLRVWLEACPDAEEEAVANMAQIIVEQAGLATKISGSGEISEAIHLSSQSLLLSLGGMACNVSSLADNPSDTVMRPFSFAKILLTEGVSLQLADFLSETMKDIAGLTTTDIGIYRSRMGTVFTEQHLGSGNGSVMKESGKRRLTEDEEWELQLKKEMAKKRASSGEASSVSSQDDKKLIEEQDKKRLSLKMLFDKKFRRLLASVESLVASNIEIGNSCLPLLSPSVLCLSILDCPAMTEIPGMKLKSMKTLTCLATCVYEIQEEYAPMMAVALQISCSQKSKDCSGKTPGKGFDSLDLHISPLPSPCEPAAATIFEMDEFQDQLSGASFSFLFPVIRAALMGPRTTPGCEGALRVLERHTVMLAGEECDVFIKRLRIDMVSSVLELLKHDRAQAFNDPNPYDTLIACYNTDETDYSVGPALSTAELAPLLDERGALGGKNCRAAAMMALGSIAENHKKLLKNNPLVENRIWLNCFDENESVRAEARKTWGIVQDQVITSDDLPSPPTMYAVPLLSLLNNGDQCIAAAAAQAYSQGMKAHPNTVNRNIQKLCSAFIESFPSPGDEDEQSIASSSSSMQSKVAPTPVKKPLVSTGLKKQSVKKSALQVAGIGQPKKKTVKKNSAVASALLKPKQERTLDQAMLESQFNIGPKKTPAEKDSPEKASDRLGIIKALATIPPVNLDMDIDTLKLLTSFLMTYGIADGNESVNTASRDTLRDVIAAYGSSDEAISFLLPRLEDILKKGITDNESLGDLSRAKIPRGLSASNQRKVGAVVALGSVSLHLRGPENASKIDSSVDMLLESLKTPNASVQASVADALAKLMKKGNTQDRVEEILDQLMNSCLEGESTSTRQGAAYGIAASVKGSGIATLKKFNVVARLEEACSTGSSMNKEGSLYAIQSLCLHLGLLFEPYVIVLLPSLLKCFGDGSDNVRKAASQAVGVIMSKLSAHGVKLVLPAVLTSFNDNSWRTKQASINMLGSMSHLAPKQLASALPKVVPKLTEAFADTHPKVKASAQAALDEISSVIRNPEIHDISTVLLKALTDPADNTLPALEALIATEFLHAIDAPSLALIVPILHRGLRDRAAATKRYAALITGNICTMINDPRDFIPYLPTLMPDLKSSLLDPIPDVRSIAAKALGSLTRGLGEDSLPDMRPWLIDQLRLEGLSSAERSGAAQGLTEVLIASGSATVDSVMLNDILPLACHPSPSTREGVLWVLCFLPPALGQGFTSMLDNSLPPLINGLSDEHEQVRDVAMRAGRVLIKSHGKVHFDKILPILQSGMGDVDFRIRLSSLMLLGDLLSMIGGTTVLRTDGDTQDDIRRAERAQAQLTLALGIQTRNRVLSDIYLARSDNAVAVRQAAVQVWKTVVSVTGRTLRQILQTLVGRVVSDLASGDIEKTETAGKCLGDIVGKLGDSVLPEIIPVLRNSLYVGDDDTRRGVCVGLTEVIGSSTKDQILRFLDIIVKVIQDALCDDDVSVREIAASSFQNLYNLVGSKAMDEVVPSIMVSLESSDDEAARERALNGLTGILSIRSKELLPYIIPKLIQQPITQNHAKALSSIATVTQDTLFIHFRTIVPAVLTDLSSGLSKKQESEDAVRNCAQAIFEFADESGVNSLIGVIAAYCSNDKPEMRRESCWAMQTFVEARKNKTDFYDDIPVIIRELIQRFNDENMDVVKAANAAYSALSKHVPPEELAKHIEYMRNLINSMVSDARRRKGGVGDGEFFLPGFNIPKGLEPLLPIYQRGILYGTPTIREASAAGLGEVITLTSNKYLAGPLIIKMTGPLLRIVGDRNPSNVKIAILKTLGLILVKGGPALRAFVPQFQTTFVKALSDPSRQVRVEAISALGLLMPLSTRVDPLIKELVSGSLGKGADDGGSVVVVQTATLEALAVVLEKGGGKAKLPDSIPSALEASTTLIVHSDESVREAAAKVLGASCDILGPSKATEILHQNILFDSSGDDSSDVRHGKACSIRRVASTNVGKELDPSVISEVLSLSTQYMKDDELSVQEAGIVSVGAVVGRSVDAAAALRMVEPDLLSLMGDLKQRLETHQALARCLCLALQLADVPSRVAFLGTTLLGACLKLAMSGSQRVQFAFNDVLWLALNVADGQDGLNEYSSTAMFEDARQMKSLHSKVLVKMKKITILDD
ncbi:heat repeat-containing protein [Nitzschia inconspicua]|uniref:Heat repeat-containing protein n=1 Tax=Nitzschia inconspicua TaxID=303405 RepID=A0A9K3L176_9STRA|nr:heat repeat-containing protein [Nitzschia inconspicua]